MTADFVAVVTLLAVAATGIATVVLAWKTSNMAAATEKMAQASVDGVVVQREELEAVRDELRHTEEQIQLTRDQLNLAHDQFEAQQLAYEEARQAARPLLETSVSRINPADFNVAIKWIHGTEPAFDPEVWVKQIGSVYNLPFETLPAGTELPNPRLARLGGLGINANFAVYQSEWPFPETDTDDPLGANDFWAGITWRSDDGYRGRHLVRYIVEHNPGASPPLLQRFRPLIPARLDPPPAGRPEA